MSSPAKAKGTNWESLIVSTLAGFFRGRYGLAPRRVAQAGIADTGDVHGISPFVGQAKAYASVTDAVRLGVAGAVLQAKRAGEDYGVAFVKKPRHAAGEAYAVMRLEDFARVLLRLRRAEEILATHHAHHCTRGELSGLVDYATHCARTSTDAAEIFPRA